MKLSINLAIIFGFIINFTFCDDTLVFVQVVWRHGDRTPTTTFVKDPTQENDWPQGFGQLTELGMRQHMDLGKTLRDRYVDGNGDGGYKLLNPSYKSNEIYVRSTDVNRTMISAISNMIAMFPGPKEEAGCSYPNITEWPKTEKGLGFIPIPIHTINDDYDYTLNPDMICKRQGELWNLTKTTPEYKALEKEKATLLNDISKITGMNVTLENLWIVADALFIDRVWKRPQVEGINQAMFDDINKTNDIVEYWNNGLNLTKMNGIDFSIEVPKIRGGSLLWSIIGHMQQKIACLNNTNQNFCPFFKNLKYYAYSAHDTTIAALFTVLGLNHTNWNEDGYPHYSSAVAVELWQNDDIGTNSVKFVYFPLNTDGVSHSKFDLDIPYCYGKCTVELLASGGEIYRPNTTAHDLCAQSLDLTSTTSTLSKSFIESWSIILAILVMNKVLSHQLL